MGIKEIIAVDDQTNTETHRNIAHLEIEEFFEIDESTGLIISDHSYMPDTPGMKVLKPE